MPGSLLGPAATPDLHVMTFNVRRRLDALAIRPADRWSVRRGRVRALLRSEQPHIAGIQEALPDQARTIGRSLGDRYRRVGRGRRADGSGEGCPLFYDAERLELLDWSQTALSDHPSVDGSVSWGNLIPRVLVVTRFADRETSSHFTVFNTHLDPFSRRSRELSAVEIRRRVLDEDVPALVLGDLNARDGSSTLDALLEGGTLRDAWASAARRETPEWGTFPNYRDPVAGAGRIDWIAVSSSVEVIRAGINARTFDGGWPSDHLPVQAHVRIPAIGGVS